MSKGSSCSTTPSGWLMIAVPARPPSGTSRLARKVGVPGPRRCAARHVADQPAAGEARLALRQHERAHDQVAVEQPADADEHDRRVRRQVAELVGGAPARGDHRAARRVARRRPGGGAAVDARLPAGAGEQRGDAVVGRGRRLGELAAGVQVEGGQRLLAHVLLVVAQVGGDLRRVARDAQAGRDDQERQDEQEPPGAVDRGQPEGGEHLAPERSELVDVVDRRLVLLDDGADHRGDADHRQQRDREAHRRQQLDRAAQRRRARAAPVDAGGAERRLSVAGTRRRARQVGRAGEGGGSAGFHRRIIEGRYKPGDCTGDAAHRAREAAAARGGRARRPAAARRAPARVLSAGRRCSRRRP